MNIKNFDTKEYLESKGIEYHTEGKNVSSGWIGITCPFSHCSDRTNHCGINLEENIFSCWICGESGNIIDLIKEIEQTSRGDVIKNILPLYTKLFATKTKSNKRKKIVKNVELPKYTIDLDLNNLPKVVKQWLKKRRFKKKVLKNVKYCLPISDYPFRLLFPIIENDIVVSYVLADTTGKAKLKYIICPDDKAVVKKTAVLYGLDDAKEYKKIVIVEGLTDKLRIGNKAIGILGKRLYNKQAKKIAKFVINNGIEEIIVFLDIDAKKEAYKSMKRNAVAVLSQYIPSHIILSALIIEDSDKAKDPDELKAHQIEELKSYI